MIVNSCWNIQNYSCEIDNDLLGMNYIYCLWVIDKFRKYNDDISFICNKPFIIIIDMLSYS